MSPDWVLALALLVTAALVVAASQLALGVGVARKVPDARRAWGLYAVLSLGFGVALGFLPIEGEVSGGEIADCGRLLHPDRSNNVGGADRLSSDVRGFCRRGYEERASWLIAAGVVALVQGAVAVRPSTARSDTDAGRGPRCP